ncbi:MAG: 60 kDa chaperonin 2 [Pseudomonadota bacterium]|jgi:NitT/TauT family transport system substrate-binding protein
MSVYRGLIGIALLAGLGLYLANNPNAPRPIDFATNHWLGYEPLYVAEDSGVIDPQLLRLRTLSSTTDVFRALRHGEVVGAALTLDEVLLLAHQGLSLTIVAVADISNGADAVLLSRRFPEGETLAGKRIAYEGNVLGAFMVARMVDKLGLSLMDVALVEAAPHEHAALLKTGAVDAVVTYEPYITRMKSSVRKIFTSKDIPGEIVDVLAVDEQRVTPAQIAHLIMAWRMGVEKLSAGDDEVIENASRRHQLAREDVKEALLDIGFPNVDQTVGAATTSVDEEHLSRTIDRLWDVMQHVDVVGDVALMPSVDIRLEIQQ